MSLLAIARVLVDESEIKRKQMGKHNISEIVAVQGWPCAPTRYTFLFVFISAFASREGQ
jgi:hypothetical protein